MSIITRLSCSSLLVMAFLFASCRPALAQNARLAGFVYDQHRDAVPGAVVSLVNEDTGAVRATTSDKAGAYSLVGMPPAKYRIEVTRAGFSVWRREGVVLEIQQEARLDVALEVAGPSETIAVEATASPLGTHDGSLGLVVDRRIVQNTPLAGRTFQALIELAPGVIYAPSAAGTFSINGQRRDSNYFTIDGVSANFNIFSGITGQASVGTGESPAVGATGGYNGLVSVDAIQEVRVQTSSFAPEYGRTPGGQISVVTRSGGNALHGSLAGIYRPDALQARDWYANYAGLPTSEFGQQIYAGTLGGPVIRNKVFYFGSYERTRLRNPIAVITDVPSLALRSIASPQIAPLLNAWAIPTGPELDAMRSVYTVSYGRPTDEDSPTLRVDVQPSARLTVFGRYAHSQSTASFYGASLQTIARDTDTATIGATWLPTSALVGEFRFNYSKATAASLLTPSSMDGAVPPSDAALPAFIDPARDLVQYSLPSGYALTRGVFGDMRQQQMNVVGSLSYSRGAHQSKLGFDIRTLTPSVKSPDRSVSALFGSVADVVAGVASSVVYSNYHSGEATFRNLSVFVQDAWRLGRRLTATYGLRWDVNPAPSLPGEQPFHAIYTNDISRLDLVESESSLWPTRYSNLAPRLGVSYALTEDARTTVSAGGGLFYDLGTQSSGNLLSGTLFPFRRAYVASAVKLPLPPPEPGRLDPVKLGDVPYGGTIYLVDPDMRTPRTTQWNVKVEREAGTGQLISVAYSGNRGSRLLTTQQYLNPNVRFTGTVNILRSTARSTYHALLVSYRRRTFGRAHMTASYTLSSARDNASTSASSAPDRPLSEEWGPSEFDVRHNIVVATSFEGPQVQRRWLAAVNGWGLDLFVRARSAFPLAISTGRDGLNTGLGSAERPNLVPGQPIWLVDASVPAGQRLNRAAFALPTVGAQGDLERNSIRGLWAKQVDLSVRRSFAISRLELQVRLDAYNVFNWPQHGQFVTALNSSRFGLSQASLNSRGSTTQAASPQYSPGGSRTCDLQVRVSF